MNFDKSDKRWKGARMTNREKFRSIFGVYAEEFWAYPKDKMLDWLQYDVPDSDDGDTISRQAAIDAMCAVNDSICEQQAIDALCDLPSAQQWIPVTEQTLPNHNSVVVVCGEKGTWDFGTYRGLASTNIFFWNWKNNTVKEVHWWMYKEDALQKPWEGGDSSGS